MFCQWFTFHFPWWYIPKGTILDPLLFLLYINDLPNCFTNSYPRMQADYTHRIYADKDVNIIQSCLNEDLLNISKWLIANKLTLNITKTEFMLIGSKQKLNTLTASPVLTISGTPVNQVSASKSLGVLIDANPTWGSHIQKLAKKISSGIAAIKRVRQFVPPATLHLIYKALTQPHFDYCNVVWGSCGIKQQTNFKNSKIVQRELELSQAMMQMHRSCSRI